MNYRIFPPEELLEADVRLPQSKSVSNRAMIINALSGNSNYEEPSNGCGDTKAMREALESDACEVNIGGAGTAMRFLTAYFAMQDGREVLLDGDKRMRCRPIGVLVDALRQCGADIEYAGEEGFPPLKITGKTLSGGVVEMDSSVSSQYVSAMLMIAPYMAGGLTVILGGESVSMPYIDLTLDLMRKAGASAEREGMTLKVDAVPYSAAVSGSEGDWSAASYWYEIEALTSGFVTLRGLDFKSHQGDRSVADVYAGLGVDTAMSDDSDGVDLAASPELSPRLVMDFTGTPDLVQTVAVTCAMLGVPFRFSGISTLRIKETDRVHALKTELAKVGVEIECSDNLMSWDGRRRPILSMPEFDTYGDHRMAMAMAPVSVYIPGVVVKDVEVVDKSYPDYWRHLEIAGFVLRDADVSVAEQQSEDNQ